MINLYLTWHKAEQQKKSKDEDKRYPVPYYVLGFIGNTFKNKSDNEVNQKLTQLFDSVDYFNLIYTFYSKLSKQYSERYAQDTGREYNVMIKSPIDIKVLNNTLSSLLNALDDDGKIKYFIEI
jgi:hypothetical protein